jgi:hypothetical protein
MWASMLDFLRGTLEFVGYIAKFLVLVLIAWGVSVITPLNTFQAGVLLMIFWFLNLYKSSK